MSDKLQKLLERQEQLKKQIELEQKRLKDIKRRERKRKIEIIGKYYLEMAEKNGGFDDLAKKLLDAGCLNKASDKDLFDVQETPIKAPTANTATTKSS